MIRIKIKELLQESGHTKYWLYKKMGLSYQNLTKLMNNETGMIKFENIEKLCRIFECNINDLFEIDITK